MPRSWMNSPTVWARVVYVAATSLWTKFTLTAGRDAGLAGVGSAEPTEVPRKNKLRRLSATEVALFRSLTINAAPFSECGIPYALLAMRSQRRKRGAALAE